MKVYFIGTAQIAKNMTDKNNQFYQIAVCSSVILATGAPSNEESIRKSNQKNYRRTKLEEILRIIEKNTDSTLRCEKASQPLLIGFYLKDDLIVNAWNTHEVIEACDNKWVTADGTQYLDCDLWKKIIKAIETAGNLRIKILGNSYFVSVAEDKAKMYLQKHL